MYRAEASMKPAFEHIARLTPAGVATALHIGAGSGSCLDAYRSLNAAHVALVEGDADTAKQLRAAAANAPGVEVSTEVVGPQSGPATWYKFNLQTLNGLRPASPRMEAVYPRLRLRSKAVVDAHTLADLPVMMQLTPAQSHVLVLDLEDGVSLLANLSDALIQSFEWIVVSDLDDAQRGSGFSRLTSGSSGFDGPLAFESDGPWRTSIFHRNNVALENIALRGKVNELTSRAQQQDAQLLAARQTAEAQSSLALAVREEVESLKKSLAEHGQVASGQAAKLQMLKATCEQQLAQLGSLAADLKAVTDAKDAATQRAADLEQKLYAETVAGEAQLQEAALLRGKVDALEPELQQRAREIDLLRAQLQKAETERTAAIGTASNYEEELRRLKDTLQSAIQESTEKQKGFRSEIDRRDRELQIRSSELAEMAEQKAAAEKTAALAATRERDAEDRIARSRDEILGNELHQLAAMIAEVKQQQAQASDAERQIVDQLKQGLWDSSRRRNTPFDVVRGGTVLVAGMRHSGSTALFNIIRIGLEEAGVEFEATYAEHERLSTILSSDVRVKLVKIHEMKDGIAASASFVFTTVRDLRDSVASAVRRQFQLVEALRGCVAYARYNRALHSQWVPLSDYTFTYETFMLEPLQVTQRVLAAVGLHAVRAETVLEAVLHLPTNQYETTLLSPAHITDPERKLTYRDSLSCGQILQIEADSSEWLGRNGYSLFPSVEGAAT
jgi:hypothetical protein